MIVIQDADCEYDPSDFRSLLQPIVAGHADVAYGTRYGHYDRQVSPWWHQAVNQLITILPASRSGCDSATSKLVTKWPREHFEAIVDELREARFGIEIELTARWARRGLRFTERPIRYQHRWYDAGKKSVGETASVRYVASCDTVASPDRSKKLDRTVKPHAIQRGTEIEYESGLWRRLTMSVATLTKT